MSADRHDSNDESRWLVYRRDFPALSESVYLNNCSLPPLSSRVAAAGQAYLSSWLRYGAKAWFAEDGWLQKIDAVRRKIAKLIGAEPEEIALAPSVSAALASLVSAIDFRHRHGVVITDLDFPSLVHHFLAKRTIGCHCTLLKSDDRISVPLPRFEHAIDQDTALVATSRVFYASGAIQDVKALAEMAHERGALLLIDDYQAAGQLPIDVRDGNVDMLVGGTGKWLLGGPGLAYVYIKKELIETLNPTTVGWFGHERQLDFRVDEWQPRGSAARFELGTPPMAAVYTANAGLDIVLEAGPENIRKRLEKLTDLLIADLSGRGLKVRSHREPKSRSAIVMVECARAEALVQDLAESSIIVDTRSQCLRISPYFFNTTEELRTLVDYLDRLRSGL